MQPGDIYYSEDEDNAEGRYRAWKVLKVEPGEDGIDTVHLLWYVRTAAPPTPETLDRLEVWVWHVPIARNGLGEMRFVAHRPVLADELKGYFEHLKRTDFYRYAAETGQSAERLIEQAQAAFREGLSLSRSGLTNEAIQSYQRVNEIIPQYFEAIDNQAFCYMDLADWETAIGLFQQSIAVNDHTLATDFSIGECYYKMGEWPKAREWLDRARRFAPDRELSQAIDRMMARIDRTAPRR